MSIHYASKSSGRGSVLTPCGLITAKNPKHSTRIKEDVTCPLCLARLGEVRNV